MDRIEALGRWGIWRMLRQARETAGLSQRELAARVGTSQPAISDYESGRVAPSIDTLSRLLTACGFSLRLQAVPSDPDQSARAAEVLARTPRQRVEHNRRVTSLAARAAASRRQGRIRPLEPRP